MFIVYPRMDSNLGTSSISTDLDAQRRGRRNKIHLPYLPFLMETPKVSDRSQIYCLYPLLVKSCEADEEHESLHYIRSFPIFWFSFHAIRLKGPFDCYKLPLLIKELQDQIL